MSKPVNPMAIGGFMLGGLALLIVALMVFGGGQFFKPKIQWVVYFDTSLNGLNVGAPVKVQGVQVGIVKEIELQLDSNQQRLMKPVVLEIEPDRLATPDGQPFSLSLIPGGQREEEFKRLIDAGLRARLEVQSILTGLLYVDLDFHRSQAARLTGMNYKDMPEVPSIPPTVDEVLTTLEDVVRKIRGMPLEAMVDDMAATLAEFRRLVSSGETRRSQAALTQALENTQSLMAKLERDLPVVLKNLDQTLGSVGQTSRDFSATARETQSAVRELQGQTAPVLKAAETTMRDFSVTAQEATLTVRELRGQTGPLLKSAETTLLKATEALESTRDAAGNIAETTAADSSLQDAVAELRKSAQSLRQLTDYLERHPDAVLFGKSE